MATRRLVFTLLLSALAACSEAPPGDDDRPVEPPPPSELVPPSPTAAPPEPSEEFAFSSMVAEDLTGDGIPDTLQVEALGTGPLAIPVSFTIRSQGAEIYRLEWESHEYFRYEPDLAMSDDESAKYAWVQSHLDSILVESNFASLSPGDAPADPQGRLDPDTDPVRLISGQLSLPFLRDSLLSAGIDSVSVTRAAARLAYSDSRLHPQARGIWAAMTEAELRTFLIYAGGENTRRIAWSEDAGQFLTVWSCC